MKTTNFNTEVTVRYIYRTGTAVADESFTNISDALNARKEHLYRNKKDGHDEYWQNIAKQSQIIQQVLLEKVLDL